MIEFVERKSMKIRPSGRSTDFISPSFGHGCLYNCTYCYMKRHKPEGLSIAKNIEDILISINNHVESLEWPKKPNQTHEKFYTYDISCNEDISLHLRYYNSMTGSYDFQSIFNYFRDSPKAFGSFATKYSNPLLLNRRVLDTLTGKTPKIRIRMSLMPEDYRKVLEPNTSSIFDRMHFINLLKNEGYDVHVNFSPVIVYPGALELYAELFRELDNIVHDKHKESVLAEVIFLTHNKDKHQYNLDNHLPGEELIWRPEIQRTKKSQYGGENLRYEPKLKSQLIKEFTKLHDSIIPWNQIRYIF